LIGLVLLHIVPEAGFDKWRTIQRRRPITGLLGTDIHRNVRIDPVCTGLLRPLCEALAGLYPNVLTLLISGGFINLTDGERLDSYVRIMSWLDNRVLANDTTPRGIESAIREGRVYGVFTIFGDVEGFRFVAHREGVDWELGTEVAAPATLRVQLPDRPIAQSRVSFTEAQADTAEIRAQLFRTDGAGTTAVAETTALGDLLELDAVEPGAYHVEVRITPLHLEEALGSESALANDEYLWIITNPIRVIP
jgi:hypothetical protein